MTTIKAIHTLVPIAGVLALVLGFALWGGCLYTFINLHMLLGLAVVLGLWALAALALRRGVARGLAAASLVWGLATLALGPSQTSFLVGDLHWIVQVAHLLLGLGAVALAALLAESLRREPAT
jgi:hypothetical protein